MYLMAFLLTPVFAELNKDSIRCTKPILMINGGPKNRLLHIPRKMNHFAHEKKRKKKQIIINVSLSPLFWKYSFRRFPRTSSGAFSFDILSTTANYYQWLCTYNILILFGFKILTELQSTLNMFWF